MLNEELATAIMLGDGRDDGDEGKRVIFLS